MYIVLQFLEKLAITSIERLKIMMSEMKYCDVTFKSPDNTLSSNIILCEKDYPCLKAFLAFRETVRSLSEMILSQSFTNILNYTLN